MFLSLPPLVKSAKSVPAYFAESVRESMRVWRLISMRFSSVFVLLWSWIGSFAAHFGLSNADTQKLKQLVACFSNECVGVNDNESTDFTHYCFVAACWHWWWDSHEDHGVQKWTGYVGRQSDIQEEVWRITLQHHTGKLCKHTLCHKHK